MVNVVHFQIELLVRDGVEVSETCLSNLKALHSSLQLYETDISKFNKNYLSKLEELQVLCGNINKLRKLGNEDVVPNIDEGNFI